MTRGSGRSRGLILAYSALVAVGAILATRCWVTVGAVLGPTVLRTDPAPGLQGTAERLLPLVLEQDALVEAANAAGRDPFSDPPPAETRKRSRPKPKEPEPPPSPVLRALLYDNVNPSAQISVGEANSGWLHKGTAFRGWIVREIEPERVFLVRDGQVLVLRVS